MNKEMKSLNTNQKIVLKLEGSEENNYSVRLDVFVEKINSFMQLLKKEFDDAGDQDTEFEIVDLSRSSPFAVWCAPILLDQRGLFEDENEPYDIEINKLNDDLNSVRINKEIALDSKVSELLHKLSKPIQDEQVCIELHSSLNGADKPKTYELDSDFYDAIDNHIKKIKGDDRKEEKQLISRVEGKLEEVNIHNKREFKIFPVYPENSSVKCIFKEGQLEEVKKGIGSFVSVSGECHFQSDDVLPKKIIVREFEIFPPSQDLLSWEDLIGIAPDITGGKSAVEYVRELRDALENVDGG